MTFSILCLSSHAHLISWPVVSVNWYALFLRWRPDRYFLKADVQEGGFMQLLFHNEGDIKYITTDEELAEAIRLDCSVSSTLHLTVRTTSIEESVISLSDRDSCSPAPSEEQLNEEKGCRSLEMQNASFIFSRCRVESDSGSHI